MSVHFTINFMGPFGHWISYWLTTRRDIIPEIGKRTLCTFEEVEGYGDHNIRKTSWSVRERPGALENALER